MTHDVVEQVDRQGIAAWDGHDVDGFVGLFAEQFVWNDLTLPEPMRGREQARQYMEGWFTAFPDMRVTQTNRVVGEDAVAAEIEFTGTNTGPMLRGGAEVPPTGKSVRGRGAYFARIDQDGKIVAFSSHPDVAGLMTQLDLLPAMG
jgi:steroid delta-isomerase-like uncharacterized protein